MTHRICVLLTAILVAAICCAPQKAISDREAIEAITGDLESGVTTGDLMKIENHLSPQAKQNGYEANRFLIECSYDDVSTQLAAQNIKVMSDSAHLSFVLMPSDAIYSDSLSRSHVRLLKTIKWKIESFHLVRN